MAEPDGPLDGAECFSRLISKTRLLTAKEEVHLAHTIRAGGPGAQMALHHFVKANQRLVYSIARRYQGQGLEFVDLVSEGNVGLLRAIERFDPARGNKFSTMAVWWIRQAIIRAIAEMGTIIRLPDYQHTTLLRLKKAEAQFMEEEGRSPFDEELAERLELSLEMLRDVRRASGSLRSLSDSLRDEEGLELGNVLVDPAANPEEEAVAGIFSEEMERVLKAVLTEREYLVVQKRFGLQGEEEAKLAQVGQELGISRERVRQIEERALAKLREEPQLLALCLES